MKNSLASSCHTIITLGHGATETAACRTATRRNGWMDGWMLDGMDARFAMLHILHASADYSHSRGSIGVAPE